MNTHIALEIAALWIGIGVYYIPTWIGIIRDTKGSADFTKIFCLNSLLGWTVIMWCCLLFLAITGERQTYRYS